MRLHLRHALDALYFVVFAVTLGLNVYYGLLSATAGSYGWMLAHLAATIACAVGLLLWVRDR